jgi:hypothetical protein
MARSEFCDLELLFRRQPTRLWLIELYSGTRKVPFLSQLPLRSRWPASSGLQ